MIHTFIKAHFRTLQKYFGLSWKRVPAYSTIRYIIHTLDSVALERAFREHANLVRKTQRTPHVSLDGKTIRGSFDHVEDQKAVQVFSALYTQKELILAHEFIEGNKTNEIPVAQKLIEELGLTGCVFTADAMHCQKKR